MPFMSQVPALDVKDFASAPVPGGLLETASVCPFLCFGRAADKGKQEVQQTSFRHLGEASNYKFHTSTQSGEARALPSVTLVGDRVKPDTSCLQLQVVL